jgi:hypothetical protein
MGKTCAWCFVVAMAVLMSLLAVIWMVSFTQLIGL